VIAVRAHAGARSRRAAWRLAAIALLSLAGCSSSVPTRPAEGATDPVGARSTADAAVAMRSSPERFVVLTVRNPLAMVAARAASTPRGYDGARAYRVGASARRAAAAVANDHHLAAAAEWPIDVLGVHCLVFRLPDGADRATVLAALERDPRVESVQPLAEFATLTVARDDPYRPLQKNLDALGIDGAHGVSRGRGVKVAVVDTAVDVRHPDLDAARITTRDVADAPVTPDELHGTQVVGVIAAVPSNGIGIVGVAPEVDVLALRACWNRAPAGAAVCNSFTLARALAAAIDARVDVLNLSLGGPPDALLQRLVGVARGRGTIVVGAVAPGDPDGAFPARVPGVIAVRESGGAATHPNDVAAPGVDVLTLVPGGAYDFTSGSSLATAEVSGVVALLLAARPHARAADVLAALQASAPLAVGAPATYPSVNACRALVAFGALSACPAEARVVEAAPPRAVRTAER
jgi:hypothetical protein